MTFAYKRSNGAWAEIVGPFTLDDIQYPANWADLATSQQRSVRGIYKIAGDGQGPLSELNGRPVRVDTPQARDLETERQAKTARVKALLFERGWNADKAAELVSCFIRGKALVRDVEQAGSVADLDRVDITAGWPA